MVSSEKSPLPDHRRRGTSPTCGQLPMTSFIGTNSILDSVIGVSHYSNNTPATITNILGRTDDAAGTCFVQELRPQGTAKGNTDWYDECTESLGFESLVEKKDLSETAEVIDNEWSSPSSSLSSRMKTMRMCGVSREKTNLKVFPPLITTLDSSGRPRFSYEKVSGSDGRLSINMVDSNRPDLVHYTAVGDDGKSMVRKTVVRRDQGSDDTREEHRGDGR